MEAVRRFLREAVRDLPDDMGSNEPDGTIKLAKWLQSPRRKRAREDSPPAGGAVMGGAPHQVGVAPWALISRMLTTMEEADRMHELQCFEASEVEQCGSFLPTAAC